MREPSSESAAVGGCSESKENAQALEDGEIKSGQSTHSYALQGDEQNVQQHGELSLSLKNGTLSAISGDCLTLSTHDVEKKPENEVDGRGEPRIQHESGNSPQHTIIDQRPGSLTCQQTDRQDDGHHDSRGNVENRAVGGCRDGTASGPSDKDPTTTAKVHQSDNPQGNRDVLCQNYDSDVENCESNHVTEAHSCETGKKNPETAVGTADDASPGIENAAVEAHSGRPKEANGANHSSTTAEPIAVGSANTGPKLPTSPKQDSAPQPFFEDRNGQQNSAKDSDGESNSATSGSDDDEGDSSSESSSSSKDSEKESEEPTKDGNEGVAKLKGKRLEPEDVDADGGNDGPVRTKNEVDADRIEIEPVLVTIAESDHLVELGTISSILEKGVIVRTAGSSQVEMRHTWSGEDIEKAKALNVGSILCFEDRTPLGRVFDTFGPVHAPYYIVRFNKQADIESITQAKQGARVFYVKEYSEVVYGAQVRSKGYDSSNMHDEEADAGECEYSDDEAERAAKSSRKRKSESGRAAPKHDALRKRGRHDNKDQNRNYSWHSDNRRGYGRQGMPPYQPSRQFPGGAPVMHAPAMVGMMHPGSTPPQMMAMPGTMGEMHMMQAQMAQAQGTRIVGHQPYGPIPGAAPPSGGAQAQPGANTPMVWHAHGWMPMQHAPMPYSAAPAVRMSSIPMDMPPRQAAPHLPLPNNAHPAPAQLPRAPPPRPPPAAPQRGFAKRWGS